jgi:hypothetical protein
MRSALATETPDSNQAPHPDWSGYYRVATARQLVNTGFKQDYPGEQLNALVTPHLQPWAKARQEATDGIAEDPGQVCLPTGMFRYPVMAGIFTWLEEPGRILMVFSNINTAGVKRVYMDRDHPKHLLPTWNGDAVGKWAREADGYKEGDTLIIDTIGFNDKSWLFGGMQPHTEEAHMIERIRHVKDGLLEFTITVEDRHALTSPYTYKRYFAKQQGEMPEEICNEDPDTWREFRNAAIKRDQEKAAKQAEQAKQAQ